MYEAIYEMPFYYNSNPALLSVIQDVKECDAREA